MDRFENTTIKCTKLNIEVFAAKKFSTIPDGNSLYENQRFVENVCYNEKCSYYNRCKITDFKPIN